MRAGEVIGIRERESKNHLSPLMKRLSSNAFGNVVNVCPFGCKDHELDDNGHCEHLVGFATPTKREVALEEGPANYEPVGIVNDERAVIGFRWEGPGKGRKRKLVLNQLPIQEGDKLIQGTVSYRVYRNVPKDSAGTPASPADPKKKAS